MSLIKPQKIVRGNRAYRRFIEKADVVTREEMVQGRDEGGYTKGGKLL